MEREGKGGDGEIRKIKIKWVIKAVSKAKKNQSEKKKLREDGKQGRGSKRC